MSELRYPSDLPISLEDFNCCKVDTLLSTIDDVSYSSIWQALCNAARQSSGEGRLKQCKVLWLLADACSLALNPLSTNEPFKPQFVLDDRRSIIPSDFELSDIDFFVEIYEHAHNPWLRARIADLVWLLKRPRRIIKAAQTAIDAYQCIPLDLNTWNRNGKRCWERALNLALSISTAAEDRVNKMESSILSAYESASNNNELLALWLADLLHQFRLAENKSLHIAEKLKNIGFYYDTRKEYSISIEYFNAANAWYSKAGDTIQATDMTVEVAERWVKQAVQRTSTFKAGHIIANGFYEKAIQIYRKIPNDDKPRYKAAERITELQQLLTEAGIKSISEFETIKTPEMDISEFVEEAKNAVKGKEILDALFAFANIISTTSESQIRSIATDNLNNSFFTRLFSGTYFARDGRVIAKQEAIGLDGNISECKSQVWAQMIRDYQIHVKAYVHAFIVPAHQSILIEHQLGEIDFISIASQSPIIPPDRAVLFGKALYAGYDRDIPTAIHILAPQLEYLVRYHLKTSGVNTIGLNTNGIENEWSLSTLMELPQAKTIFGEDLSFEIRALFCEQIGPNIRNQIAHGLLSDFSIHNVYTVYAWWFIFKMVFNTYWNATQKIEQETLIIEEE